MVVNNRGVVAQQTDYYPFGYTFNKSGSSDNKYLYNGKELQGDEIGITSLDWLDYGWRMYDPILGRWHVIDPLAEKYAPISPYAYVANNPLRYIDPDGRRMSPYYDIETGSYLGFDEDEFYGQIMVTTRAAYNNAKKNPDGSVQRRSITKSSETKNIQDANLSDKSMANVYTDIISKTDDESISSAKLYNGSISVFNNKLVNGKAGGYNDPEFAGGASCQNLGENGYKITMNRNAVNPSSLRLNTVENIQNTLGAHEILGHGINGIGGDASGQHHKVYEIQMSHPTWFKTTENYKKIIVNNYLQLLYRENRNKYNSDPNVYQLYKKYAN